MTRGLIGRILSAVPARSSGKSPWLSCASQSYCQRHCQLYHTRWQRTIFMVTPEGGPWRQQPPWLAWNFIDWQFWGSISQSRYRCW